MFKLTLNTLFALIICNFSHCSTGEVTYTAEVKDEVRYVHNLSPKWGNNSKIRLEFVQTIGGLDQTDENYTLFKPRDVAVDSDENIYVLDNGNYRVQKYSKNGVFLTTFGERGQGPGEFDYPVQIEIDYDNIIYVSEWDSKLIITFDPVKGFLKNYKVPRSEKFKPLALGNFAAYPMLSFIAGRKPEEKPLILVYTWEGKVLREIGRQKIFEDENLNRGPGNIFEYTTDASDNFYFTFHLQNRIEKYSKQGKLLMEIDRVLPYDESETYENTSYINAEGRRASYNNLNIFSERIQVDAEGRIWTYTLTRQYTTEEKMDPDKKENIFMLEVFNSDGVLLTTVKNEHIKSGINFKIFGNKLFIIDQWGEMAVYEYKIVEK